LYKLVVVATVPATSAASYKQNKNNPWFKNMGSFIWQSN